MFHGIVGTPGYIAPEVASGRGLYSAVRADLWSCGKTLYEFCECCQPSVDRSVLLDRIIIDFIVFKELKVIHMMDIAATYELCPHHVGQSMMLWQRRLSEVGKVFIKSLDAGSTKVGLVLISVELSKDSKHWFS